MLNARKFSLYALTFLTFPAFSFADTTFNDGTFNLSDYSTGFLYLTGPLTGGVTQCLSCGNPGQALVTSITLTTDTSASSTLAFGALNNTFVYDPSTQGAIWTITASVDNTTSIDISGVDETNQFIPLIEQDGNFYSVHLEGNTGVNPPFQTLSATLTASDFEQYDPSDNTFNAASHPNFAGDTMTFGLVVPSGSIALPSNTQTITYDNLSFDLATTPEPASLALVGAALAGLGLLRRKSSRGSHR